MGNCIAVVINYQEKEWCSMGKVLVSYFSASGVTKRKAEDLAKERKRFPKTLQGREIRHPFHQRV